MRKTVGLLLAAAALVGVTGIALADSGNPPTRHNHILGEVLSSPKATHSSAASLGSGNLVYHGGPVELTNTTYAIYWVPSGYSVSSNYESVINQYFTDVAADSGKSSNVYDSDTEYYNSSGTHIAYSSHFGGYVVDTNPFPASGCNDSVSQTTVCLSDAQIQTEVKRVASAEGWPQNLNTEFFMFTAKNVGSCAGSECAFAYYCAYHSNTGNTLYANMPYSDTVPADCDAGQHPNNSDADATLNVTSHEHNETITDELGTAWYDRAGYEDGDKCAWKFGTQLGSTAYGQYNELINGHPYELQMEYSNSHRGCIQTGS